MGPALPRRERNPCGEDNLVGPHQALPVAREQAPRARRVESCQPFAKSHAAQMPMKLDSLLPHRLWDFGNRRQTVLNGTEVETGAADDDRQPTCRRCCGDLVERQRPPVSDRTALGSIEKAVEPMRRSLLGGRVGTRRQDAEIAIDLLAVGVDNGSIEGARQLDRNCRFAASRWPGNDKDRGNGATVCAGQLVAKALSGVGRLLMEMVLTLIAGVSGPSSLPRLASEVAAALGIGSEPSWLAPGEACDLVLDTITLAQAEEIARTSVRGAGIDIVVQPIADRRKRLLVADLESTIIENEMLDELAERRGIRPRVAEITRRAMNGEIDFITALEARVTLLKGMRVRALEDAAAQIRLTSGARALVATMRREGAVTALVSGGFTVFAEPVAAALGFDRVVANRLDLVRGQVSGTVQRPIVTRETKRDVLLALAAEFDIAPARTIAVGDGANDLPMLAAAGIGVAFRPKPVVAEIARWRLDYADLTGLLYAQGYRKDEIVG
jgi:phosphoserine phosphatase